MLPLIGEFQAMNALAALGLAIATGVAGAMPRSRRSPQLTGVPGRMELVGEQRDGAPVIVDYAHTPDALANACSRRCARMPRAGSSWCSAAAATAIAASGR